MNDHSFQVTVRPSGRRFEAQPTDSILDAGLRAGLNLAHGCANGSCGDCRVRVLSGEVDAFRHHDFRISDPERASGTVLACCQRVLSDVEIEAHEIDSVREIPEQSITARITRLERLQGGVTVLHLRTPRSRTLQFLAGQQLQLTLPDMPPRQLLIASCPCDGLHLRFHVDTATSGAFGQFVASGLEPRTEVGIVGPQGAFVLDESSTRPLLFLAWNTGFAAIESLIEHVISLELPQPVAAYWVCDHEDGHYLANQCRAWQDALDTFQHQCLLVSPASDLELDDIVAIIQRQHPGLSCYDIYMTVPERLQARARELWLAAGVPAPRVRSCPLPE